LFKIIKNYISTIEAEQTYKLKTITAANQQLEEAIAFAKADADAAQWGDITNLQNLGGEELSEESLSSARSQSRRFVRYNPHARAIIRNLCKFIIGKGVTFTPKFDKDPSKAELKAVLDYWAFWVKHENFLRKQKESVRRLTRDGEFFHRFFENRGNGITRIRFMEPDRVDNPQNFNDSNGTINNRSVRGNLSYGIETSRKDIESVFFYYYITGDKTEDYIKIPAKEVIHKKLFADSNRKRGIPFLETMLYDLKSYREWLKDRVVLNKIRTSIALVREVDPKMGSRSQVQSIRDQNKTEGSQWESSKQQMIKPGTVLTAKGVQYKFLSPELDARDSATDGRNILLTIAAGAGLPEYMVTSDSSNANYSSTMVAESPGVREFEDLMDELRDAFIDIWDRVMYGAFTYGKLKGSIPTCELTFPVVISRDIKKEADAFIAYNISDILSKKTVRSKIGADDTIETDNLRKEKEEALEWEGQVSLGSLEPTA